MLRFASVLSVAVVLAGSTASADVAVVLSDMHLCCGACVKAVDGIGAEMAEKFEGVAVKVDKAAGTCAVSGPDRKGVQQTINAIARAGFYGKSDNDKVKMKLKTGIDKGKVSRLELIGVHNCCGGCNKAIVSAIESVDGVTANTARPKSKKVVIEGEFDAAAVVTAMNKAGFYARTKVEKKKKAAAAN